MPAIESAAWCSGDATAAIKKQPVTAAATASETTATRHGTESVAAEYDGITSQYRASKLLPFRRLAEIPTIVKMMERHMTGAPPPSLHQGDSAADRQQPSRRLLSGRRLLDLACGEGFYSRLFSDVMGADAVVGVDISPGMIDLAKQTEAGRRGRVTTTTRKPHVHATDGPSGSISTVGPRPIHFLVGDAIKPNLGQDTNAALGTFDVVTAIYLFNYATSYEDMVAMMRNVKACLKPVVPAATAPTAAAGGSPGSGTASGGRGGGVCIAVNDNPFNAYPDAYTAANSGPLCFTREVQLKDGGGGAGGGIGVGEDPRRGGEAITYTINLPDGTSCSFDNYWHQPSVYEAAASAAGLKLTWIEFGVDEEVARQYCPISNGYGVRGDEKEGQLLPEGVKTAHEASDCESSKCDGVAETGHPKAENKSQAFRGGQHNADDGARDDAATVRAALSRGPRTMFPLIGLTLEHK